MAMQRVILRTVCLVSVMSMSAVSAFENIFEKDSEFMKGFETGLLMRSKDAQLEDYGCTIPESSGFEDVIFDTLAGPMAMMKAFIPDETASDAITVVEDYLAGLRSFITVLKPNQPQIDMYCRGLIFGMEGSRMLVKIATHVYKPFSDDDSSEISSGETKRKKSSGKKFDLGGAKNFKKYGSNILKAAQSVADAYIGSDEL
eukprot:CAMPEP_0176369622 /NCGR_PEP_ID=MMETSP0126-20121128/23418_1 /TAXON_ID=141414 ORGANISM="Strombidinopsis acuminatum, Strain SPMC142" /NCGR_SAMPLE_ID=MMETSP0126 /ASSEMBLY_ACC=CAM_ASM_000229 /LENGTH=200 /DNA_ID=CAMNT_0017728335 /DNA_START=24 /DNA_END=626 /DNA_ORIENTATION=+